MTAPDRTLPFQGSRRQPRNHPWRDYALFFVLVGPNLGLLILFVHRPLIDNIRLSLYDWNFASPSRVWLGLGNYREWWGRDDSWEVVRNTLTFSVFAVAGSMMLGLALAMLLDQQLRGRNLARGVIFAPFVLSGAAVGLAAQFVFDPKFGFVQDLLRRVGISSPNFYQDPEWALFMVTVTYIWKNLGYTFVIYLAALQGVRQDLMEAAQIDGAGPLRTFRRVLLPQLRPTTFFLSITVILNSLQVFDLINTMTRGGPLQNGTTTMVYQVYVESFRNLRPGYGSAVATIMFAALLVITVIQVRVMDRADAR